MIKKILIANRGEIACRVIKTARKMGIKTVAVYSEADEYSKHVLEADESLLIGPASASESYLSIEKIINAAKEAGADAIHPGYGFLSENARFVQRLLKEKIKFIGPNVKAIKIMGDKIQSKNLAIKAKVNTIPGFNDVIKDYKHASVIANDIGFPLMIKASAGGGGKGMRIVKNKNEVKDAFQLASNEAKSSFGDDRVFIEKYIEKPRHIEIQVLADIYGNVIHLGERECSIQRRHQKIIEEAPSSVVSKKLRNEMGEQAKDLAKAVEYQSAGTVEFIVDQENNFYFLEMNTRLQVEHPVTEEITGFDLVEQMIRVADEKRLKIKQEDVKIDGWAMEARIYSEDPIRNFLPSVGRVKKYIEPVGEKNVRLDSGIIDGSEVSINYDPMLAKLIVKGKNRDQCIKKIVNALNSFYLRGFNNNIKFLISIFNSKNFCKGDIHTGLLDQEYKDGYNYPKPSNKFLKKIFVPVAAYIGYRYLKNENVRNIHQEEDRYILNLNNKQYAIKINEGKKGIIKIIYKNSSFKLKSSWKINDAIIDIQINKKKYLLQFDKFQNHLSITYLDYSGEFVFYDKETAKFDKYMLEEEVVDLSKFLLAPMPGKIVSINVKDGQKVKSGENLLVLEAMKMENLITASKDAKIKKISVKPNDAVEVDQILIEFDE
ncbi:MAG: Acetyl-/propionyl-coenzyme A carboxylase alpha chain [Alphaproteobacteria bacterium MarineAlpha6_Bin4]|nr:MAG: Acetyl-/propionyl-coenzyme A carboxylase alpha chain [Alphaproteobacteria bacterium MarineAlpha6_Bin3]PPR38322.1 MAG: Acetyl-/propionyl-coenzyme A carboxylase alpha chain [Alphaproteobacteria bacterium MarineAlpha6_Bin4]|tara:strand:+ start:28572 stop:30548 length:1977 start_codon:yes stop_codon:yes gene_type:complete